MTTLKNIATKTPGGKKLKSKIKSKRRLLGRKTKEISKNVNTPGEGQRAFKGSIDRMISKAEGDFNKMIKNWRAKTRS